MEKLSDILSALKISSQPDLLRYIAANYGKPPGPFAIVKTADLHLDTEDRLYKDIVRFENTIIDVAELNIRDSHEVTFRNCVITGNVHLTEHQSNPPLKVHFHRCVCLGKITMGCLERTTQVVFDMVNLDEFRIVSSNFDELHLTACHFRSLSFEDVEVRDFDTFANQFNVFEVYNFKPHTAKFDHAQVSLRRHRQHFNPFLLLTFPDEQEGELRGRRRASTMQFLLQHTGIHRDRDAFAAAKYLLAVATKPQLWARTVLRVFGAFIKPMQIVFLAFLAFLLYAALFSLPAFSFLVNECDMAKQSAVQRMRSLYINGACLAGSEPFAA